MRWEQGRGTVDQLIAAREVERVRADLDAAESMVEAAPRHLVSAEAILETDPEGAYAILYDATRKAFAALLEAQGLRATSRGGHVAIREVVTAQFGGLSGAQAIQSFDRLRRRRNDIEYPGPDVAVDADEVSEALDRATEMVAFAGKLFGQLPVF